jgi:hypothetical protein
MNLKGWGLGAILLLLSGLAACSPGSSPTQQAPAQTLTVTPTQPKVRQGEPSLTPSVLWFQPTHTPVLQKTRPPQTPTSAPTFSAGEVILQEDFSDRTQWQTGQSAGGAVAYGKNELTLAISKPKTSLTSLRQQPILSDFYLEVTLNLSLCLAQDLQGILFRASSLRDFYRLLVSCSGQIRLERLVDGQGTLLQDWMPAVPFIPGSPSSNRVGILAVKNAFQVYINGVLQFSQTDNALAAGRLGVYARSMGDNALTISFTDLVVRHPLPGPLGGPGIPATPAATPTRPSSTP